MITSIFIKMLIIDLWQEANYRDTYDIIAKIIITMLVVLLLIPVTFICDLILSPIEIGATIIFLIGERKQ